jgi:hypothetical protein
MKKLGFLLFPLVLVACADSSEHPAAVSEPLFKSGCPGSGCGSVIVDQVSEFESPAPFTWGIGGSSNQILGQVVTPVHNGRLIGLDLAAACTEGAANELDVEIRDVDAGQPGSSVLLRVTVPNDEIGGVVSEFVRIDLLPGVFVSAGTQFAIVLSSPGECGTQVGLLGDPYDGGDGWFIADPNPPDVWVPLTPRRDLPFRTVVRVLPGLP